jgi:hypothetical protein
MTENIRDAFREQAESCRILGSPFTAALCSGLADTLQAEQGAVAAQVLGWQGDPRSSADSVPLRLCGALHAVVLTGMDPDLSVAYERGKLSPQQLVTALQRHEKHVLHWLTSAPQTNEVARSAPLIAAARFLTAMVPHTLHLRELGASAGLNLNFDKYNLGDALQGVVLRPDWQGDMPQGNFTIDSRRGVDLNPLDPEREGLRLMAYCWADQTERLARLKAALELAANNPLQVDQDDAGAWLTGQLATPAQGTTLVFHTVAAQYFPRATQAACANALTTAGNKATAATPLAHLQMEADGGDGAALTLTLWDGQRRDWSLGRADFHGRWVRWNPARM